MNALIKKILIEKHSGKKYFVKDILQDFYTAEGTISKKDLQSKSAEVKTNKNKTFLMIEPSFSDLWESLQRGPQIMLQKDIGFVLAKTGVNNESTVVDAGGGSGSLCLSLANVCKQVTTYEIHPEHYNIVMKNKDLFGMKNLTVKKQNIALGIDEKELDLITLDLPEPWEVVPHAKNALKSGGFVIVYLPNLLQIKQFIEAVHGTGIRVLETIELLERKWKIEERIMRPEFEMLGHTGFLVVCRKLSS